MCIIYIYVDEIGNRKNRKNRNRKPSPLLCRAVQLHLFVQTLFVVLKNEFGGQNQNQKPRPLLHHRFLYRHWPFLNGFVSHYRLRQQHHLVSACFASELYPKRHASESWRPRPRVLAVGAGLALAEASKLHPLQEHYANRVPARHYRLQAVPLQHLLVHAFAWHWSSKTQRDYSLLAPTIFETPRIHLCYALHKFGARNKT